MNTKAPNADPKKTPSPEKETVKKDEVAATKEADKSNEMSADEEKDLEKALDAADKEEGKQETNLPLTPKAASTGSEAINKMLHLLKDKKGSFVIYGYGGVTITLNDLRMVAGEH